MFARVTVMMWIASLGAVPVTLQAQDLSQFTSFTIDGKTVQAHGFVSQGFVATNQNNWLTMDTSSGSFAMTEGGVNLSSQITDKFRVGAQVYDRDYGQLGKWHPELDWALADFRFKPWFGIRAGKIKTTLGLFNDSQDMDFLHVFALLPQSVYSTDMRDSTLSHIGADLYGTFGLGKRLGSMSYTTYGGDNRESIHGGYPYNLQIHGVYLHQSGGPTWGGDLRWNTPVNGLLVGSSYEDDYITDSGLLNPSVALGGPNIFVPYTEWSRREFTQQFYGQYTIGNLEIDAEFRRFWRDFSIFSGQFEATVDPHMWYTSAAYRVAKHLQLGAYYSHFDLNWIVTAPGQVEAPSVSSPDRHLYDKVVCARFDITSNWYVKVEGHFMNGYGGFMYPDGFYPQVNPQGLKPNTIGLIVKTGFNF
jgi:hypothetical protein